MLKHKQKLQIFQFHKGTIKTMKYANYPKDIFTFQFHKGTIKTKYTAFSVSLNGYFNSIKVQLKRSRKRVYAAETRFQFHKGTIKTYLS